MSQDKLKTILFDLDGTLVDTAPEMYMALNVLLDEENIDKKPFKVIRPQISNGVKGIFSVALNDIPDSDNRMFKRYLDIYESLLGTTAHLFDGMIEVLQLIEEKNYAWGIVTNKSKRFAIPLIKKLGLFDRTNCLVCGDTTDYLKPNPEPILHALSIINNNDNHIAYYIGDSKKDIDAAKSADIQSIACMYGYISSDENTKLWNADNYVASPMEIIDVIG